MRNLKIKHSHGIECIHLQTKANVQCSCGVMYQPLSQIFATLVIIKKLVPCGNKKQ